MDGILKVVSNDSSISFEYGICYSISSSPTASQKVCKTFSGTGTSISLSMPVRFLIEGLKPNTKYYYRAYFKDNKTGKYLYEEWDNIKPYEIYNFTDKQNIKIGVIGLATQLSISKSSGGYFKFNI